MQSNVIKSHQPCDDCGSSDALAVYSNGKTHCFSCKVTKEAVEEDEELNEEIGTEPVTGVFDTRDNKHIQDIDESRIQPLRDRGISLETAKKYKVFKSPDPFFSWTYPLHRDGKHIANKFRLAGKKAFTVEGEMNRADLFGQWLFPPGSAKTITITEGYDDAMAAYELTGSKYPVVSIHSASSAKKDCANAFEYLNSFNEIVLCFDKDEAKIDPKGNKRYPGQEAAQEVASLFSAGKKVRVLTLSKAKDANDYLRLNLRKEFTDEWWKAPFWTPQGIRLGCDLWDEIKSPKNYETVPYPWQGFNDLTYGIRLGEFVVLTADTGVGKTSVLKEIEHYLLNHTKYGLGILHLEETNADTGLGIMSVEASKPLHLPDIRETVSDEELRKYYDKTVNSDRVIIYDHFGSNDIEDLLNKIRHMHALGAKYIVLDHLSIVVSDQNGDERKQLDEISTKLKTLTMELNIGVLAVIHQNRKGEIRGTAGVEQLANIVFKFYRDKESEDDFRRNVVKVTVQKNRFCGRTGPCCYLKYNPETGRLEELDAISAKQYEAGDKVQQETWNFD